MKIRCAKKQRRDGPTQATRAYVMRRDKNICVYCGYPAQHVDHIIPFSFYCDNTANNLVAACRRCNLLASNLIFDDFASKKDFIINQLKASPEVLETSIWTKDEIDELGRGLKSMIERTCVVVETERERENIMNYLEREKRAKKKRP